MNSPKHKLEVHEDLEFQKREWIAERIGWVCLGLILLAGFLGLLGGGGLSWVTKRSSQGGFMLEYERFLRNNTTSKYLFYLLKPKSETITLWISNETIKRISVESSSPAAVLTESFDDGTRFTYRIGNSTAAEITMRITPESYWSIENAIVFNGTDTLSIEQFIYP